MRLNILSFWSYFLEFTFPLVLVLGWTMFSRSPRPQTKSQGHQQLTSDTADEKDQIIGGLQFHVRYVGRTEVAGYYGTGSGKTETVVAKVFSQKDLKTAKKMVMTVCSTSVSLCEETSGQHVANFPISLITYCNTDKVWERAFVFIARLKKEIPFKAFIFQCENKQKAHELFKAFSLAFTVNYENVQAKRVQEAYLMQSCGANTIDTINTTTAGSVVPCGRDNNIASANMKTGKETSKVIKMGQSEGGSGVKIPFHLYVPQFECKDPKDTIASTLSLQQNHGRVRSQTEPLPDYLYSNGLPRNAEVPQNILHPSSTPNHSQQKNHDNEDDEFAQFVQQRSRSSSDTPGPTTAI